MGKGDKRSKRGKIHIGSTGVTRLKKKKAAKKGCKKSCSEKGRCEKSCSERRPQKKAE